MIKTLPEELSRDKERLARFEREARLLAQLNHPNIATLHGLEECEGRQFLVMELVEGETLAERIARGPLPLDEALPLAKQIADGLEAAHEKGVIHRDLKPANIKITPDGLVKILDFGLAKAAEVDADASGEGASQSPTLTKGTVVGAIMGTAAYMSPEQARGKKVDKRCDVWAFGAVLYEMLTGRQVFEGGDASEILAGVIKSEPSWEATPGRHAANLKLYLQRCLEKDPKERVRDWGRQARTPRCRARQASARPLILDCRRSRPEPSPSGPETREAPARFAIPVDGELPSRTGKLLALSSDGRELVYVAVTEDGQKLYHRPMNRLEAVAIPGTEDPKERVRDIGDVRLALHGAFEPGRSKRPVPSRSVLVLAIAAVTGGFWKTVLCSLGTHPRAAGVALAIAIGAIWVPRVPGLSYKAVQVSPDGARGTDRARSPGVGPRGHLAIRGGSGDGKPVDVRHECGSHPSLDARWAARDLSIVWGEPIRAVLETRGRRGPARAPDGVP